MKMPRIIPTSPTLFPVIAAAMLTDLTIKAIGKKSERKGAKDA